MSAMLSLLFLVIAVLLFAAATIPKVTTRLPEWHLTAAGLAFWVASSIVLDFAFNVVNLLLWIAFVLFAIASSAVAEAKIASQPFLAANIVPLGLFFWAFAILLTHHPLP
jgi:hypothetical protein